MQPTEISTIPVETVSAMAADLIPSEIIKLGNEVNQRIRNGESIFNLTIGDFDPTIFHIPYELNQFIIDAYNQGHTNYPMANGMRELRSALSDHIARALGLQYGEDDFLVSAGARPLIYAIYKTIIDPGDKVIYALPSWNNNHYCHLSGASPIELEVGPEQNFMPRAKDILPFIKEANLIALCSPQNPTGTIFSKNDLFEICKLVHAENEERKGVRKPIYIMYDQIYWHLTFGQNKHEDPVNLFPQLRDYVIYVDGISKVFAATGVRVGWSFGPRQIIDKMRAILSHVGAWAPKAEQIATGNFMRSPELIHNYLQWFKPQIEKRLNYLHDGIQKLKQQAYSIDSIPPQAAIYLTVKVPWKLKQTKDGIILNDQRMVAEYVLDFCKIAIVPFNAFGTSDDNEWYRISVGTLKEDSMQAIIDGFKKGMDNFI